jgi:3-hydroxyisobutyrate dehydrogenase-like beta-hydroxyacid dehydrogenase
MGKHMAANLIKAGHDLTINDLRADVLQEKILAGAKWADTPKAVAHASRLVITSLPGPEEVDAVVLGPDGVLAGAQPGDVFVDMTTSTPRSIRAIASVASALGVDVLDAPVAGGIRGARRGSLTIMVGGSREVYERCEPVFKAMGQQIILVGEVGAGHTAKLVNNMMTIVNALAAMESMVVGARAGVDVQKLLEVVRAGTGDSYALNLFPYVIFKRNFEPAKFALSLAAKDLRISLEYARELGVPVSVVQGANDALTHALEDGLADKDWSSYITLVERVAGVQVRP